MRKTDDVQILVPLEDLYQPGHTGAGTASMLPADVEDHLERTYGVTAHRDHQYRLAVSLADAYKIRDARQAQAEKLHAEHLAKLHDDEAVTAWQRARERYWEYNYLRVLRAQPLAVGAEESRIGKARHAMSVLVLAAEAAADIPADIQARLSWPSFASWMRYPDSNDRPEDYEYVAPALDEE